MFQQMGFGIAVALFIDATIIRSVVVPATMNSSDAGTGTCPLAPGSPTSTSRATRGAPAAPRYLTIGAVGLALWVAAASGEALTGILPAVLVLVLAVADYALWERRNRPWHDWAVILLLLRPSSPRCGSRSAASSPAWSAQTRRACSSRSAPASRSPASSAR